MPATSPASRRPSWRALSLLGAFLLLVTVIGLCEWQGWPFLRQPLERQLGSKLHRDVHFGDNFRLHLFGAIRLHSDRFSIGTAAWDKAEAGKTSFVSASDVTLVLPYRSVLGSMRGSSEALDITLLDVGSIDARLRREADGRANWTFTDAASGASAIPRFEQLRVRDGHLDLQDAVRPLQLEASAHTAEGRAEKTPGLSVEARGRYLQKTFTASARSPGALPLIAPEGKSTPVTLTANVQMDKNDLTFEGQATDLLHFGGLNGVFRIKGPSLANVGDAVGATLPSTAPFKANGRISKKQSVWTLAFDEFSVGRSHLAGDFSYDTVARRPFLKGELRGSLLALADLAPAFGAPAPGSAAVPEKTKDGAARMLPQREFDIPSLQRMDADVAVNLERVETGSLFALPLQPLEGWLTLDHGQLKLDRLVARTADGELRGLLQLDARRHVPLWAVNLQWSGVKLEKWLNLHNRFARKSERLPVKNKPGKTTAPSFIAGELGGQAQLQGSGRSTAAMLATLQGHTNIWIRNGAISQLVIEGLGLDAAQAAGLLIRGDKDIVLRCAAVSMSADKGVLNTEAGIIDTWDSLVIMDGQISLADEKLDLVLRTKPHDMSPLALRSPLHLKGSFSRPTLRPDAQALGIKAGVAAVLGVVVAPLAALLPLLDPGSSDKGQGCAQTLAELQKNPETPAAMKRAMHRDKH